MAGPTKKDVAATADAGKDVALFEGYGEDEKAGFENQSQSDLSIPFLAVLQSNSPQVKPEAQGGMKGAQQGMLFNTVTQELIDPAVGVVFIPAHRDHVFVEWTPREKGGGLAGIHQKDSELVKKAREANGGKMGKITLPNGNDLVETQYLYGIDAATGHPLVLAFSSTKITVFKHWNTKLNFCQVPTADGRKQTPPLFAHQVRVTAVAQTNAKGDFYNFALAPAINNNLIDSLLKPSDPLYQQAKDIGNLIKSGALKADLEKEKSTSGAGGADEGPAPSGLKDGEGDEIPF